MSVPIADRELYQDLWGTALKFPAIDNHAHQLLKAENRDDHPFEGVISEATGDALLKGAIETLACYRSTKQLAELFGLPKNASWEEVKAKRAEIDYLELCKLCFQSTNIHTILIDDGLGSRFVVNDIPWHDQFVRAPCKRIARLEAIAEKLLEQMVQAESKADSEWDLTQRFWGELEKNLTSLARQDHVVGFKSAICYRTGLAISTTVQQPPVNNEVYPHLKDEGGNIRFNLNDYNDYLVHIGLRVAQATKIPVQFHTGLGDADLTLTLASPSHLQPLIKQYPGVNFVLLHSSYPYTRDAGYLTSAYANVYLDFGEVFPLVSVHGQRSIVRQMFELAPTNKIIWSTDAHFWPETYYLGVLQSRVALFEVLSEFIKTDELTEAEAVRILKNIFFHNSNSLYGLNLQP